MKQIIYATLLILTLHVISFGQETKTVARPVEGSKPFAITAEQLENLEVSASMDRFGKLDDNSRKARLDMFTSLISSENKKIEFVIQLRGENKEQVGKNMEFMYRHLVEKKKIAPTRISFAVAPEGKEATELWLVPNKKILVPTCEDCLIVQAEDKEKLKEFFDLKK